MITVSCNFKQRLSVEMNTNAICRPTRRRGQQKWRTGASLHRALKHGLFGPLAVLAAAGATVWSTRLLRATSKPQYWQHTVLRLWSILLHLSLHPQRCSSRLLFSLRPYSHHRPRPRSPLQAELASARPSATSPHSRDRCFSRLRPMLCLYMSQLLRAFRRTL